MSIALGGPSGGSAGPQTAQRWRFHGVHSPLKLFTAAIQGGRAQGGECEAYVWSERRVPLCIDVVQRVTMSRLRNAESLMLSGVNSPFKREKGVLAELREHEVVGVALSEKAVLSLQCHLGRARKVRQRNTIFFGNGCGAGNRLS